jgi:GTP1/Obg family GTP-binding protein
MSEWTFAGVCQDGSDLEFLAIWRRAKLMGRALILYFRYISKRCGYSVAFQIAFLKSYKPLCANELTSVVNKNDLMRPEQLDLEI